MKKVTMQDIADELGITKTTVYRAFNNKENVKPELRRKIMELAEKYGYKPNKLAKSLSRANVIKIGVVNKKDPQYFWGVVKKGIFDAESELADYGLKIVYTELPSWQPGVDEYRACIDRLMAENVDGIALFPMNYAELIDLVNSLSSSGVKFATFNDDLENSARLFYVGPKMKIFGRLAGELMGKFLGGKGNVLVFWDKDYNAIEYHERMAGFNDVLAEKYPGVNVVGYIDPKLDWFMNIRKVAPEVFNDVGGIYVFDLDNYLAEIESLARQMNARRFICIGHEFSANVARYLKDGTITACIKQDAYFQGYKVIKELFERIFSGVSPAQDKYGVKFDIVVAENADQFMEQLT